VPLIVGAMFGSDDQPPAVSVVKNVIAAEDTLRSAHVIGLAFGALVAIVMSR
jgi:hypothetical protein